MNKKKLKICLIAPVPPPYGGIGNWVLLLSRHIRTRNDITMKIINTAPVSRGIDGRTMWDRIVVQGILMLKKRRELKKLINNDCPDVIHITTSGQLAIIRDILLLKTAKNKKIPTIYHIHFGRIKEIAQRNTKEWKLISLAMKMATVVMLIDKKTLELINKNLPDINVVYVPNPIDTTSLPVLKNEYNKEIIFLGWIVKTKGIEELLTAWHSIYYKHSEWSLKLVGPINDDYNKYLKDNFFLNGVIFVGEKNHNEAMRILNDSAILVLPSYTEGFPNVILEAMSLAKPTIATCVGAIPEILSDDCGILIDMKNVKELEKSLEELMLDSEKRKQLGINANSKVNKEYIIDKVFSKYMEEWFRLIN